MSKIYSPKIVTDSLVMCLDASNNKSYPTDLPVKNGLVMWMDAADDTTFSYSSGTTVSQWRDKSGFNYHMVPKSSGPTRSAVLNSRKVLAFTASQTIGNDVIDLTYTTSTVFVVSRYVAGTNQRVLTCNLDSSGGNWLLGHWGGYVNQYYAEGWVSFQVYGNDTVWRVYMGDYSGVNTDLANIYSNGTAIVTNSTAASGGLRKLGVNYYSGEMSTCEVAEIIVFNRLLSATERKQVHTYLGQKWGISNTDRSIVDLSGNGINPEMSNTIFSPYNCGVIDFNGKAIGTNAVSVMKTTTSLIDRADGQEITVSCWIKPLRTSGQYSVFCTNRSDNDAIYNWIFYQHTNDGAISFHGDNQNKSSYVPTVNQWVNVVATVNGAGLLTLYINGASNYTVSGYTYGNGTPSRLGIGADPSSAEGFQGSMGQTLIYNRALSAAEVAQNYEAQKSKFANTIVQQGLVLNLDAGNPYSYGGAGTTVYDVSPTALSWTGSNVTYNSDPVKYFSYNGSNSWLQSSTSAAYDSQTITMECWCYPNTLSQEGFLFEKGQVNTQYSMFFESITNPNFVFRTMGTVSNYSLSFNVNTYLTVSAWNHIVCTYNGSAKIAYVNGVQVASVAASGTLPTGQINQYIGRHSSGYFFNGRIAESRVYNIALSAAQVLQNYNATKDRFGL